MAKQISTTDLLALVLSGSHTLTLDRIHRYWLWLVTKLGQGTGERCTLLWGHRTQKRINGVDVGAYRRFHEKHQGPGTKFPSVPMD